MPFLQFRSSHLGVCTIVLLLTCGVFTTSLQQMSASPSETVILHCNQNLTGGFKDVGWRKDGNLLFNYSPVLNQTVINYTSSRMQVDPQNPIKLQISDVQLSDAGLYECFPINLQWRLNINETQLQREILFNIFYLVTTACVAVCLFIFCAVCLYRKCKKTETFDNRDAMDEPQSHRGRVNRNQASQYFERFNSVYGQI